jgi:hypothetical protein
MLDAMFLPLREPPLPASFEVENYFEYLYYDVRTMGQRTATKLLLMATKKRRRKKEESK